MATLKISEELLKVEPTLLGALTEYFESMEEMTREHPDVKRYAVYKEGLPTDNTQVDCRMKRNDNGKIEVEWCGINAEE